MSSSLLILFILPHLAANVKYFLSGCPAAAGENTLCLCISKATLSSYYSYSDGHTSTIIHTYGALVKCFFVLFCIIFGSSQRKFGLLQTLITTTICLFRHLIKVSDNPMLSHNNPLVKRNQH